MSDIMKSIPFGQLTEWILNEYKKTGQVFGIQKAYVADQSKTIEIFGRKLENPVGPAAGPHTQLAQNLVAAYVAGARFFELKTVQKMDGQELSACIPKPCIVAEEEAYNCEWSTELYVPQAMEEYIKGWILIRVIAKEFGIGSPDGFQFNMSCGYNLEGIKDKKIDDFIEGLKDAGDTAIFKECKQWLLEHISLFEHVTKEDVEAIPAKVCNSITLSTMHGCPPQEIENIVRYLLKEKHINTYVKCNPTLLGYEFVRKALDDLGYDYMAFTDFCPFNGDTILESVFGSPFVGLKYFKKLFTGPDFWTLFRNTLSISLANLFFAFPAPIILALILNELRCKWFKRTAQTLVYIPHFVSIVIVAALTFQMFSTTDGAIYHVLTQIFGANAPDLLSDPKLFPALIVGQNIWKETGYGTIIYLAALSSVDVQLYEAAKIDGAGRWQLMWHVTLPAIRGTIVLMLIMKVGQLLNTSYEQIFLMQNSMNRAASDVFDTYVYTKGITGGQYSLATATGLFKSTISMLMVVTANKIAKLCGESGLY